MRVMLVAPLSKLQGRQLGRVLLGFVCAAAKHRSDCLDVALLHCHMQREGGRSAEQGLFRCTQVLESTCAQELLNCLLRCLRFRLRLGGCISCRLRHLLLQALSCSGTLTLLLRSNRRELCALRLFLSVPLLSLSA